MSNITGIFQGAGVTESVMSASPHVQQELAQVMVQSLFTRAQEISKDNQEMATIVTQLQRQFMPEETVKPVKAPITLPDAEAVKAQLETLKNELEANNNKLLEDKNVILQDFTPPQPAVAAEGDTATEAVAPVPAEVTSGAKVVEGKINALIDSHNGMIQRFKDLVEPIRNLLTTLEGKIEKNAPVTLHTLEAAKSQKVKLVEISLNHLNEKRKQKVEGLQAQVKVLQDILADVKEWETKILMVLFHHFVTGINDYKYAYTFKGAVPYTINFLAKPDEELSKTEFKAVAIL